MRSGRMPGEDVQALSSTQPPREHCNVGVGRGKQFHHLGRREG
jgi:hypothetical protein